MIEVNNKLESITILKSSLIKDKLEFRINLYNSDDVK